MRRVYGFLAAAALCVPLAAVVTTDAVAASSCTVHAANTPYVNLVDHGVTTLAGSGGVGGCKSGSTVTVDVRMQHLESGVWVDKASVVHTKYMNPRYAKQDYQILYATCLVGDWRMRSEESGVVAVSPVAHFSSGDSGVCGSYGGGDRPAKKQGYPTYEYLACAKASALVTPVHICTSAIITRESDGVGWIIGSVAISGNHCHPLVYEGDPAIVNQETFINTWPGGEPFPATVWDAHSPDLGYSQPDNNCQWRYDMRPYPGGVIRVRAGRMQFGFDYKARMQDSPDRVNWVNVQLQTGPTGNLLWDCNTHLVNFPPVTCTRSVF